MGVTYSQRANLPNKVKKIPASKIIQGSAIRGEKEAKTSVEVA